MQRDERAPDLSSCLGLLIYKKSNAAEPMMAGSITTFHLGGAPQRRNVVGGAGFFGECGAGNGNQRAEGENSGRDEKCRFSLRGVEMHFQGLRGRSGSGARSFVVIAAAVFGAVR